MVRHLAVQVDRVAGGMKYPRRAAASPALARQRSHPRAHQARQDIARTRSGKSCIAGWIDDRNLPRRCNHGARTLEHHGAADLVGKLRCCLKAVLLNLRGSRCQEPSRFQWMWCQYGLLTLGSAGGQHGSELSVGRNGIQGIGVDDGKCRAGQQV